MRTPATDKLPPGSELVLVEYIKDFNASATAKRLRIPVSRVNNLVKSDEGQAALLEQLEARTMRTQIDADWVLLQLAEMFQADVADIIDPNTNTYKAVHQWPPVWRRMVAGLDVTERFGRDGESVTLSKIKWIDRLRALDMIGKHVDVRAFQERVEVATDETLTAMLLRGRKRVAAQNPDDEEVSFL